MLRDKQTEKLFEQQQLISIKELKNAIQTFLEKNNDDLQEMETLKTRFESAGLWKWTLAEEAK